MGGKKGGGKLPVTNYYMSLHFGVCRGPVDAILRVRVREKTAWEGRLTANASVGVDNVNLFGGDEKEGGIFGTIDFMMGHSTQVLTEGFARLLGLTPATAPGFRDIVSLVFRGLPRRSDTEDASIFSSLVTRFLGGGLPMGPGERGFMWSQNNPNQPAADVQVEAMPRSLGTANAVIKRDDNPNNDANPAHIIYECYVNPDFGKGRPASSIDFAAFTAFAQQMADEVFGLSIGWFETSDVDEFVKEVLDHVQAAVFNHPRTGLLTPKAIRGDYDPEGPMSEYVDGENCTVVDYGRASLEETKNEIIVKYTDPVSEENASLSRQDPGNIAAQGRKAPDTRDYHGIRSPSLAMEVAVRDLRQAAYPSWSGEIKTTREAFEDLPGDVVRLTSDRARIVNMICRVIDIDYGDSDNGEITLSVTEDIFGLNHSEYETPPATSWVDDTTSPAPLEQTVIMSTPYPASVNQGVTLSDGEATISIFGYGGINNPYEIVVNSEVTSVDGSTSVRPVGTVAPSAWGALINPMVAEPRTTIPDADFPGLPGVYIYVPGQMFLLSGTGDTDCEIIMVESVNSGNGDITFLRGLYDTVPRDHGAGASVWYMDPFSKVTDRSTRTAGASAPLQFQTRTSGGLLPLADAPIIAYTPIERYQAPFRPANVGLQGDRGFAKYVYGSEVSDITISWANRNRTQEDSVVLAWDEASIAPETGQTTVVELRKDDGTLLNTYTAPEGNTTINIPVGDLGGGLTWSVSVFAEREGLRSIQGTARFFDYPFGPVGYGRNYGEQYGP